MSRRRGRRKRRGQRSVRTVRVRGHKRGPRGANHNKRRKATTAHRGPQSVKGYTRSRPRG